MTDVPVPEKWVIRRAVLIGLCVYCCYLTWEIKDLETVTARTLSDYSLWAALWCGGIYALGVPAEQLLMFVKTWRNGQQSNERAPPDNEGELDACQNKIWRCRVGLSRGRYFLLAVQAELDCLSNHHHAVLFHLSYMDSILLVLQYW